MSYLTEFVLHLILPKAGIESNGLESARIQILNSFLQ